MSLKEPMKTIYDILLELSTRQVKLGFERYAEKVDTFEFMSRFEENIRQAEEEFVKNENQISAMIESEAV